jgi:hypothetical protein
VSNEEQVNLSDCELSILVARPDTGYMMQTVSHLVRACNYPFARKTLVVDSAPLAGQYLLRQDLAPMSTLFDCCNELVKVGVIDQLTYIDYDVKLKRQLYAKHFGRDFPATHDYRGYPMFGTIYYIEKCRSPYLVHFDCDMLLHQSSDFNWIKRGIELMQSDERVVWVMPLSGPPSAKGTFELVSYDLNEAGFFEFKFFSSRAFLMDVRRFESLLPLSLQFHEPNAPVPHYIGELVVTKSMEQKMELWEKMIGTRIENTEFVRANLADPRAWTLHALDHGSEFMAKLPSIIGKVERGVFPPEQAGYYDLELSLWS